MVNVNDMKGVTICSVCVCECVYVCVCLGVKSESLIAKKVIK